MVRLVTAAGTQSSLPASGLPQVLAVACLWPACALPVPCLWLACALPVACLCPACALPVACLWPACGLPVACLWPACGLPVACLWPACGLPVGCLWAVLGCGLWAVGCGPAETGNVGPWCGVVALRILHLFAYVCLLP